MHDDYITEAIKKIIELQQEANSNQNINIGPTIELNPEQILMESILDPRSLEIKGTYLIDDQGNQNPISETIKGCQLNKEGYPVTYEKNLIYTLEDGTSFGDATECMTCGALVHKDSIFRCPTCGVTCCVLCATYSEKAGLYYCCGWHKFLDGSGLF